MRNRIGVLVYAWVLMAVGSWSWADEVLVEVETPRAGALVTARVDLGPALRWCKTARVTAEGIRAVDAAGGQPVPLEFVPDPDFDGLERGEGTLVFRATRGGTSRLKLAFGKEDSPRAPWNGVVSTAAYTAEHDGKRQGGFPWRITFRPSGKVFDTMRWNNRLHHRERGSFCACDDPEPRVERIAEGPLCTVVRVHARYVRGGKQPESRPEAVYDWYYFREPSLVYVRATLRQASAARWDETHFLELNYPGEVFARWAGGEPFEEGQFAGTMKSIPRSEWGLVHDGVQGIGMFRCAQALLYDGGKGSYLQAHGDEAWQPWSSTRKEYSAWLWIGAGRPVEAMQQAMKTPIGGRAMVTVDSVRAPIEAARRRLAGAAPEVRRQSWWQVLGAEQLELQGRLSEAVAAAAGKRPKSWSVLNAGDLGLILDGPRLLSLFDSKADVRLAPPRCLPLFALTLRNAERKEELRLESDAGFADFRADAGEGRELVLRWQQPLEKRLGGLRVIARLVADDEREAFRWKLAVEGAPAPWGVWRVVFPQVAVADLGPQAAVLFPKAAGEVQRGVWQKAFRFSGTYPGGWTSMQLMAAYDETRRSGLYVAVHDPYGSTKDLRCESLPSEHSVVMAFDHPAENMGKPVVGFVLSGEAVWQLLRGDWYDAAIAYRTWVRKEARWYPRLGPDGRADTPKWMRELSAWALASGRAEQVVPEVQRFAKYLGVPAAVHWYNWHQIPFDNDYPHYFPAQPGFAEGVSALGSSGAYVMPYINGRLWDLHDRGATDESFTRLARPAVTKDEKQEPYVETYGSKEQDGSPVRLGVMCPATELWRSKVREIVLRLFRECGVHGVYIDQVAAAQPVLCFDPSHGHALGGGKWWTEAYWGMMEAIRREMPKDRMLTTECNGEPYIHVFDGYLTWHWQYDGQVPLFPAVYGGAVQMFGRAYRGGDTKDLALRMKAGQQLVFGEQIGWIAPGVVGEKDNAAFLGNVVRLRQRLGRYFYAGEMARPPKLAGTIPTVRADWQWSGPTWVTTDAVMAGAWHRPAERRLVLVFVNVDAGPVTARVEYDLRPYGFSGAEVRITPLTAEGPQESFTSPPVLQRALACPPRSAWAWEVTDR